LDSDLRELLKVRIVADISQFTRAEEPFEYPRHVAIQEWLAFAVLKYDDRIGDVLADVRETLQLLP
jgi:hypothetical protein